MKPMVGKELEYLEECINLNIPKERTIKNNNMTKYILTPINNGESFYIIGMIENKVLFNVIDITNSREKILLLYRDKQIEKEALERYPVDEEYGSGYDLNKDYRIGYIEALKANKKVYTEQDMIKCFHMGTQIKYESLLRKKKYETLTGNIERERLKYFQSLKPKLEPMEVILHEECIWNCKGEECRGIAECRKHPKLNEKGQVTIVKII